LRLLAFDTSAAAISAVATQDGVIAAARDEAMPRGHAERLLPLLRELAAEAGWAWVDVDLLAVVVGPGGFTGLRAGLSVARALSLALGRPVLGLGAMELVAEAASAGAATAPRRPIQVVLEAGRGQVYTQRFGPDLEPQSEPTLAAGADAAAGLPGPCVLAGDASTGGAMRGARHLASLAEWRLGAGAAPVPGTALRPVYLRPPDAHVGAGASLLPARS
jgi:tRNA threonylcarbamoyladenosine biosynthesis protein TsaB